MNTIRIVAYVAFIAALVLSVSGFCDPHAHFAEYFEGVLMGLCNGMLGSIVILNKTKDRP